MNGSNGGFIALYRRLLEHPLWTQLPQAWLKAWIYILLRANHTPRAWYDGTKDIEIPAGGFVTSIEKLASSARITTRQARGSLDYFQRAGMVTRAASNRHSILIVTNWSAYQFPVDSDVTQNDRQNAKQATRAAAARRQTNVTQDGNKQQITIEQVNTCASPNGAARVSELPSVDDPPVGTGEPGGLCPDDGPATANLFADAASNPPFDTLDGQHENGNRNSPYARSGKRTKPKESERKRWFKEEFWPEYPVKDAKDAAEKAFLEACGSADQKDRIMAALRRQREHLLKDGPKFCPYAKNWLNERRFNDDSDAARAGDVVPSSYLPAEDDE